MKRILSIFLTIILILSVFSGCTKEVNWQDAINENAYANKYTLLFISDKNTSAFNDFKNSMIELAEKLSEQFVFVEVDYTEEKDNIFKYINVTKIYRLPLVLSIAPSGFICDRFVEQCNEVELQSSMVSAKKGEILFSLQEGLVTVLCIYNAETDRLSEVKNALSSVETNYDGDVVTHFLDSTNDVDKEFINSLNETLGEITVILVRPPGFINATLTDDEITLINLLSAIQSIYNISCCPTGSE